MHPLSLWESDTSRNRYCIYWYLLVSITECLFSPSWCNSAINTDMSISYNIYHNDTFMPRSLALASLGISLSNLGGRTWSKFSLEFKQKTSRIWRRSVWPSSLQFVIRSCSIITVCLTFHASFRCNHVFHVIMRKWTSVEITRIIHHQRSNFIQNVVLILNGDTNV